MLRKIPIIIVILCSLFYTGYSSAITRDTVMSTASSYANYSWYCSSSNADPSYNSYTVGWQTGVAYNWGGVDTISVFQQYINQGVIAGDSKVCTQSHCLDFAGVDCSGFVTRCWGMSNGCSDKLDTSALVGISTAISWESLQRGDILLLAGSHVQLFDSFTSGTNQMWVYDSTVPPSSGNVGKVIHRIIARNNNYIPRKYNSIVESDSNPPTVNVTSPCSSSCTSSSSSITVSGTASDSGGSGLDKVFVFNLTNSNSGYDYGVSGNSSSFSVSGITLNEGQNKILTQAYDNAANFSDSFTVYVTYNPLDTTPPDTSITGGPSGTITYNDVNFTYSGSDNVTSASNLVYSYKLDNYDSNWSSYTSSTSKSYSDLPNASYTFYVRAKDQAGNVDSSPVSRSFTVSYDAVLSHITISGSTQVNESTEAQYTCTAYYDDSSSSNVTSSANWSENSNYASITSNGYLTTSSVSSDQSCTITAIYRGESDTHNVTIKNVSQDVGSIRVSIVPQQAADAGAQWSVVGESIWRNSGTIKSNVQFGTYTIEFKNISGWTTPSNKEVTVFAAVPDPWINGDPYTQTCTYSISPTSKTFTFSGGTGSVTVTAPTGCTWNSTSYDAWITIISGSSGNGNGTLNYSVSSNSSTSSRTGNMTIADKTFTVTQDGAPPCPDCSGSEVVLTNMIFPSGCNCECVGTKSIAIGQSVTIKNGARVTFTAPKVKIQSGFHAERGAVVEIRQE